MVPAQGLGQLCSHFLLSKRAPASFAKSGSLFHSFRAEDATNPERARQLFVQYNLPKILQRNTNNDLCKIFGRNSRKRECTLQHLPHFHSSTTLNFFFSSYFSSLCLGYRTLFVSKSKQYRALELSQSCQSSRSQRSQ